MSRTRDLFASVHTEGTLLSPDLLQRVMDRDGALAGLRPEDYHHDGERLNELTAASWQRLQGRWLAFQEARAVLPADDPGTTVTRERWLLPLFQELDYGRLQTAKAVELGGRSYAVSHAWPPAPIHLVGCSVSLDQKTAGVAGAARTSPHSLVQELLNRSDDRLWAFVSNGLRLRMLRDNVSLSRQAYVEFDLEAMMEGELYSDFVLLWLLCHQSRMEGERPEECWLEKWSQEAQRQGVRALDGLRRGVENAIKALGSGLLDGRVHNVELLEKLRDGRLDKQDYYRQLLRMVYRLLFLFTAEDRGLLLDPAAAEAASQTYAAYYSTERLRHLAERRRGSRHTDLFESLRLVMQKLGGDGCPELGLPPLGSMLFADESVVGLLGCRLANRDLLDTVRHLAFTSDEHSLRPIDFRNLGAEELGSVYESLLEMQPDLNREAATFELRVVSGSERKTTGSYYTPSSLIQCLLDTALDPVVDERLKAAAPEDRERALLDLKVCDPACGSGHFLIAAAHRLARRLAAVRTGDDEPTPAATRKALRDVIGHCVYGVDINPMSVELCKVNLWMEALEPGRPLSFLDHRIQCGNSLLGATPALLRDGIPDDAFRAIEGDDKKVCTELRKQNKKERAGQTSLFGRALEPWERLGSLASGVMDLNDIDDATPEGVREKQACYERVVRSSDYLYGKLLADTWCAAFVWPKTCETTYQITEDVFRKIEENPHGVPLWLPEEVQRLATRYRFFHWHLQFPDVFRVPANDQRADKEQTGWNGGFDVVLGNPPWERFSISEEEWFASRDSAIADAQGKVSRVRRIRALEQDNPPLWQAWLDARREAEAHSLMMSSDAGLYPLTGRGELNMYHLFTELSDQLIDKPGFVGLIVKTGIGSANNCLPLFQKLTAEHRLRSLYDFVNTRGLFPGVQTVERFSLIVFSGTPMPEHRMQFATLCQNPADLRVPDRVYELSSSDVQLMSPLNGAAPLLKGRRDAVIMRHVYREHPILDEKNTGRPAENWSPEHVANLHMTTESRHFMRREEFEAEGLEMNARRSFVTESETYLPLYEGKFIYLLDHRFGSFETVPASQRYGRKATAPTPTIEQLSSHEYEIVPRYWFPRSIWESRQEERGLRCDYQFLFRNIAGTYPDLRTAIGAICPALPAGNKAPALSLRAVGSDSEDARRYLCFAGMFVSLPFDYILRNKLFSKSLTWNALGQVPMPAPTATISGEDRQRALSDRLVRLGLELSYTTELLEPLGHALGVGEPTVWDPAARFLALREIDALAAHLYGLERPEFEHVLSTFATLARKEEKAFGRFRTAETALSYFDSWGEGFSEPLAVATTGTEEVS